MKEPKAVAEAKLALRAKTHRLMPLIGVMMLGWLPVIPLEQAGIGAGAFMAVYGVITMLATAGIVWDEHRTRWATTLVSAWEQHLANRTLEDSLAGADPGPDVPSTVIMERIREHLELDQRALAAAEAAYDRMQRLGAEERSARAALEGLPEGAGRDQLGAAAERLRAEVDEIQGTLATLYATLINRDAWPSPDGLKDTMLELEAETEVAEALLRQAEPDDEATDPGARARHPQTDG